jgi:hypothetical protein
LDHVTGALLVSFRAERRLAIRAAKFEPEADFFAKACG